MLPPYTFVGTPVLSLQYMLRSISFQHPAVPRLIPDGVFGEETLEAVMTFQREFYPPVTGRVDQDTWDAVVNIYQRAARHTARPRPCRGYPCNGYIIEPEQSCVHLYLIQSMFKGLHRLLNEVEATEITGVMDAPTVANTRWLQRLNGAEETGVMDMETWDTLTRLHDVFVTFAQTPWITRPELLAPPVG